MAIRVQRKRNKGWRKPAGAVNCTRPGKYGNPFILVGDMIFLNISHRRKLITNKRFWQIGNVKDCVNLFRQLIDGTFDNSFDSDIQHWVKYFEAIDLKGELADRDLMCFCALDQPCHTDVLLEIANQ